MQTALLLDIPRHSLKYWQNIGLLSSNKSPELSFADLVRARFITLCRKQGISLQALRRAIAKTPSWQQNLTLYADHILAAREEDRLLRPEDKQILLDFEKTAKSPPLNFKKTEEYKTAQMDKLISELEIYYQEALEQGDIKEMEKILKKTIKQDPKHLAAWVELGNLYFNLEKTEESCCSYERALELDPRCSEALYNLANLHFKQKRYAAAIRCFQSCLHAEPQFAEVYYNLGLVLYHLNYFNSAIEMLEAYLYFDPNSFWADQARQLVENAHSLLQEPQALKEELLPF